MELVELEVSRFRNLEDATLRFSAGAHLIYGTNGAGKTSLLEAIVMLGNLRSFRTPRMRPIPRHGESSFRLKGTVISHRVKISIEQRVEAGPPMKRGLFLNGAPTPPGLYLQILPIFAVTGSDRDLVFRGPEPRRALIDRFAFLLHASHLDALRSYRRALRQRNAALAGAAEDRELDAWEGSLASAAAKVVDIRRQSTKVLQERFSDVYRKLRGEAFPDVEIRYRGDPWCDPEETAEKVEDLFRQRYNETRKRDRQNGFTGDGPHRHDLSLRAGGRGARYVLSTGQSKVVAAALRLATLAQVEKERGERFPVIVDDVDAELDKGATDRLLRHLGGERQLFLSSTDSGIAVPKDISTDMIRLQEGSHTGPGGTKI